MGEWSRFYVCVRVIYFDLSLEMYIYIGLSIEIIIFSFFIRVIHAYIHASILHAFILYG